jgi:hypothetical protein
MAFIDRNLEFSDAQAVTSTAISTDQYDTLTATTANGTSIFPNGRIDFGVNAHAPWIVVSTNTTCTDTGSDATLTVTLETADDSAGTTNATVLATSGTLAFAAFASAGTLLLQAQIPSARLRRWLYVRYTVASGPLTAGAFDAYLSLNPQRNVGYRSGYTA